MTILEYLLLGVIAVAAIYTGYRLFLGWRASATENESDVSNGFSDPAPSTGRMPRHDRRSEEVTAGPKPVNH